MRTVALVRVCLQACQYSYIQVILDEHVLTKEMTTYVHKEDPEVTAR